MRTVIIFTYCSFTKSIWANITSKFGVSFPVNLSCEDQLYFLPHACDQQSAGIITLAKLCFLALVRHVWLERDNKIFNGEKKSSEIITLLKFCFKSIAELPF